MSWAALLLLGSFLTRWPDDAHLQLRCRASTAHSVVVCCKGCVNGADTNMPLHLCHRLSAWLL